MHCAADQRRGAVSPSKATPPQEKFTADQFHRPQRKTMFFLIVFQLKTLSYSHVFRRSCDLNCNNHYTGTIYTMKVQSEERVNVGDVSTEGRLRLDALFNIFQEMDTLNVVHEMTNAVGYTEL